MAFYSTLYQTTKKNARTRGIPFDLSRTEFDQLVDQSHGCCMVTGIPFEFEQTAGQFRRPFAPSIDRVASTKGYEIGNVRLVCVLVNLALNEWGIEPLKRVAQALIKNPDGMPQKPVTTHYHQHVGYMTLVDYEDIHPSIPQKGTYGNYWHHIKAECDRLNREYIIVERRSKKGINGNAGQQDVIAFPLDILDQWRDRL